MDRLIAEQVAPSWINTLLLAKSNTQPRDITAASWLSPKILSTIESHQPPKPTTIASCGRDRSGNNYMGVPSFRPPISPAHFARYRWSPVSPPPGLCALLKRPERDSIAWKCISTMSLPSTTHLRHASAPYVPSCTLVNVRPQASPPEATIVTIHFVFVGHITTSDGIQSIPNKVARSRLCLHVPTTVKCLRSLL